jgi:ribose transport system ATP-binding protein
MSPTPALSIHGASKHFGGVTALDHVEFSAYPGEVQALLGQNGSGKSTLVKLITGYHAPDPGAQLQLWGRPVNLPITAAHEHGIAVIHQDLGLVESMTVLENLGITSGYRTRLLSPISFTSERRLCRDLLAQVGLTVDPNTLVSELSPPARAALAIARAQRLLQEHTERFIFILDEPTAYLSANEAARVAELMRVVADSGSAVIFISHRLQEVLGVADRITVLRDGRVLDTFQTGDGDERRVISAMLGRSLEQFYPDRATPQESTAPTLRVDRLAGRRLASLTFEAAAGEIVGFTGLEGMGHAEIPYLLAGAIRPTAGTTQLDGIDLHSRALRERIRLGIALVPGNRGRDGAWPAATARENVTLPQLALGSPLTRLRLRDERHHAASRMARFQVRPPHPERNVDQFSGGNQQKIVLAKWIADQPKLLLLDEPTQGIDAGSKLEILKIITDIARLGAVVLIFSGDYEQLANVCNRVLVFRHGTVSGELRDSEVTEGLIAQLAQATAPPTLTLDSKPPSAATAHRVGADRW